ncbi:glycosyltransferase [Opitutales bacterium]|jgi:N-acetylglucosaminyl-diphospho-decaprenol L-rhamnosyltransferase|nr:glycosyltransferase [Opitutales bacterium]
MQNNKITLSVVSHGHGKMVKELLNDLMLNCDIYRVIITINLKDEKIEYPVAMEAKIITIINTSPKGFSENHNYAFKKHCTSEFFCVINPDVRIPQTPFPALTNHMKSEDYAIVGPVIKDLEGRIQDSARYFPKPSTLFLKAIGYDVTRFPSTPSNLEVLHPDWIAGMFMLIRSSWFQKNPFDEKFFLYYEDIDLCLQCWKSGNALAFVKEVYVIHNARRDSHKRLFFFALHIRSILYFFYKNYMRFPEKLRVRKLH